MAGRNRQWVLVFVLAAMATAASIVFIDKPAALYAHAALVGQPAFVALTHLVDPVPPLAGLGFLAFGTPVLLGWRAPPGVRVAFCVCVAVLVAIAVKDQLKYAFGRTWPETWVNGNPSLIRDGVMAFVPFHGGTGWSSFPSGHVTLITAPMAVLMIAARAPLWRAAFLVPILLVVLGLFGADYHYVGDLLAGGMVGSLCAAVTARLLLPGMPAA